MSDFRVSVEYVSIHPHNNSDNLEIAQIGDYQSVVLKGKYKTGDLVAYIPEDSVLPDNLIEEMGLTGKLAGSRKNRIRAVKLRGILSQGICYPAREGWNLGDDVSEELNIKKYEPPILQQFRGLAINAKGKTVHYDIENIKKYPDVFQEGEEVCFTEKVHGTLMCFGMIQTEDMQEPEFILHSKGLGKQGIAFKLTEDNSKNLYYRTVQKYDLFEAARNIKTAIGTDSVYILGEVLGCQDLKYGFNSSNDDEIGFRVFDIFYRDSLEGEGYLDCFGLSAVCLAVKLMLVPVLYIGPFSKEKVKEYTTGIESVSGTNSHMREGIVIKPISERFDEHLEKHCGSGRVILKSVSEQYLLRKNKNATEYT